MVIEAPYYHQTHQESDVFIHAFRNRMPLLLKGPTGSGKSRFVEYMAYKLSNRR
ncbi:MAG TPA: AAA family ATPase [Lunatimonas sp.]|nr:AAA family ATPase [Lunatimonas sp.]